MYENGQSNVLIFKVLDLLEYTEILEWSNICKKYKKPFNHLVKSSEISI